MDEFDDLDVGLDEFDKEFEGEGFGSPKKPKKDRNATVQAAENAVAGVKDNIRGDGVVNNVSKVVNGAMPSLLGDRHSDTLNELKDEVADSIDEFKESTQKAAKPLLKNMKTMVPKDGMFARLVDKVADLTGVDIESSSSASSGPSEDEEIANNISSTFQSLENNLGDTQTKMAALTMSAADANTQLLAKGQTGIFNTLLFHTKSSDIYYKKSLELSYKQLFELKRIVKGQIAQSQTLSEKLDLIVKNTGLPDAVKLRTSEAIKRQFQTGFGENLYGKLVQDNSWVQDAKKSVKKRVNNFKSSLVDAMLMGDEAIMGAKEMNEAFSQGQEMADPDIMSPEEMAAFTKEGMIASQATDFGKSAIGRIIGKKLASTKMGRGIKSKIDEAGANPYEFMRSKANESTGFGSWLWKFGSSFVKPQNEHLDMKVSSGVKDKNEIAEWDGRSYTTLNSVIPGYLSKMLNELMIMNKKKPHNLKFDYTKGEFRDSDKVAKDLREELSDEYTKKNVHLRFNRLVDKLEEESGVKLSKKERRKFIKSLASHEGRLDVDNFEKQIEDSDFSKSLTEKEKLKFTSLVKNAGAATKVNEDGETVVDTEKRFEINTMLKAVENSKIDARKRIESLIDDGFKDRLIKIGLIEYDKIDDSYSINYDKYKSFNISALMDSFDSGKMHISKTQEERLKEAQKIRNAAKETKDSVSEWAKDKKDKVGTFIKDKKIDVYFKDKFSIIKKESKNIFDGLKGKVEETEAYKIVMKYLDDNLKPLKEEYVSLKTKLKTAKEEDKLTLEGALKEVKTAIDKIEKEKEYYGRLKKKAEKTKKYVNESDAYSVENDIINLYGKFKSATIDVIEDRELDILFDDLKKGAEKLTTGTKSIYQSTKGKIESTEAYKQAKEYYDIQLAKLEDKEKLLQDMLSTLPPEQRKKVEKKLKKVRVLIAKQKRKASKELGKIGKDSIKNKGKDLLDAGFTTIKEDFKYTKVKSKTKEGAEVTKDIAGNLKKEAEEKAKDSAIVKAIGKLTDVLTPKKKKSVLGDNDGDGKKDNSWWSILKNRKKKKDDKEEKDTKKKKEAEGSFLGKILKGIGFTLIPALLTKMFNSTTKSFGLLDSLVTGVTSIAKFFGMGKVFGTIKDMFIGLGSIISRGMVASSVMGGGIISKLLGNAFTMLGMKKIGDFFFKSSKAADIATKKIAGKKSIFKRIGGFVGRNKKKLIAAGTLGWLAKSTVAGADDAIITTFKKQIPSVKDVKDMTVTENKDAIKEGMVESGVNAITGDEASIEESNEEGSFVGDMAMMLAGNYVVDKAIDGVGGLFKRKKKENINNEIGAAKKAVNATSNWISGKIKFLRKPSVMKRAAKIGLKKIPGIGLAVSLGTAIKDLAKGSYKKASLGILSGMLAMVPILGTAASVGVDMYADSIDEKPKKELSKKESNLKAAKIADEIIANEKRIKHNKKIVKDLTREEKYNEILKDKSVTVKKSGKAELYYKDGKLIASKIINAKKETYVNIMDGKQKGMFKLDKERQPLIPPKILKNRITKGDRYLLEFIAKHESKRGDAGYEMMVRGTKISGVDKLTDKTINEIFNIQKILRERYKTSGAVGKYQFIPMTLAEVMQKVKKEPDLGINNNTMFTPLTQDILIKYRLIYMRHYDDWKQGKITDEKFGSNLSFEFASLKAPGKSKGNYDDDGRNHATATGNELISTLRKVRELDGCIPHPENGLEEIQLAEDKKSSPKQKESSKSSIGGSMVSGLKQAIKALMEFMGVDTEQMFGKMSPELQDAEGNQDAEGTQTINLNNTNGNLDKQQVDLPSGVEDEMCGIKFKRLPITAFGKAVSLAKNRHFENGRPKWLMVHNTAGSNLYLGRMKSEGYGTQIWIDKSGEITIIGDLTQIYYHVGKRKPEWRKILSSVNTIGIEMVCNYKNGQWEQYTEAQKKSLLQVGKCLMMKFSIDKDHIVYHEQTSYKTKDEGKVGAMLLKGIDMTKVEIPDANGSGSAPTQSNMNDGSVGPTAQNAKLQKETSDAEGGKTDVKNDKRIKQEQALNAIKNDKSVSQEKRGNKILYMKDDKLIAFEKTTTTGEVEATILKGDDRGTFKVNKKKVSSLSKKELKKNANNTPVVKTKVDNNKKATGKKKEGEFGIVDTNSVASSMDPTYDLIKSNSELLDLGHKRLKTLENIEQYMKAMSEKENATVHHHYDENKKKVKTEKKKENKTEEAKKINVINPDKEPMIKLK